ncbi:MAG: hypothetical protein AAF416_13225 [Pseudomonadota bacterium]
MPGAATSSEVLAQLPQGDPARKLAVLHWQEVHLEEMVASACYVSAGVEADANRNAAYVARDAFEATLPDIMAEVSSLDGKNPAVRRIKREIADKKDQWYRFRIFLETGLKAETPAPDKLSQLALLEEALVDGIEDVYKAVRRKAAKQGTIALADSVIESAGFNRVFAANRLVKTTCLIMAGRGDTLDQQKLSGSLEKMERQLDIDESSLITKPAVKELIPAWRAVMPRLRTALESGQKDAELLAELRSLAAQWTNASGVPTNGLEQS